MLLRLGVLRLGVLRLLRLLRRRRLLGDLLMSSLLGGGHGMLGGRSVLLLDVLLGVVTSARCARPRQRLVRVSKACHCLLAFVRELLPLRGRHSSMRWLLTRHRHGHVRGRAARLRVDVCDRRDGLEQVERVGAPARRGERVRACVRA